MNKTICFVGRILENEGKAAIFLRKRQEKTEMGKNTQKQIQNREFFNF